MSVIQNPKLTGLYRIALDRLIELNKQSKFKKEIIRFPVVFMKLCRCFCINKKQCWDLLFTLRNLNTIKIIPFQGIQIKKNTK